MVLLTGCSLFGGGTAKAPVENKDVPFQARAAQDGAPRKRLLILPFIDAAGTRSVRTTQHAREAMIKMLMRTDSFVIINNSEFPRELGTYLKNGEYDIEAIAKVASGMGLAAIVEGKILDVKAKRLGDSVGLVREIRARMDATVGLRMAATKNAKVVLSETREATVEDSTTRFAERAMSDSNLADDPKLIEAAITKAVYATVPRIVQAIEKLSWEGRVALIKGDKIYLNAGRLSGLQVGDILKITEDGEDVYDPETGGMLGRVPGRMKGTVEIVSYFGKDGSVAVIHSGSGFRENDLVELY
jgi:hypothetical protein